TEVTVATGVAGESRGAWKSGRTGESRMPTKSGGLGEFGARCVACRSLNEKESNRQQGDRDELSHGFTPYASRPLAEPACQPHERGSVASAVQDRRAGSCNHAQGWSLPLNLSFFGGCVSRISLSFSLILMLG